MSDVRIATRRSRLAIAQATWVGERLVERNPHLGFELLEIVTAGDADRSTPVAALTEVGAFVRAVQRAVLEGEADLAVHSCKDLPVAGPPGLETFYPRREVPWDVLCGSTLSGLREGARVGTGSPRRRAQLSVLRPDLQVDEIRGNVDTRLSKVASGEFDAVVLAEAGLRRIGLDEAIRHRFTIDEMIPAPAQAALAVEALEGGEATGLAASIDDPATRATVGAEREVLARTGAGCRAALGVFAESTSDGLVLSGFVDDDAGPRRAVVGGDGPDAAVDRLIESLAL